MPINTTDALFDLHGIPRQVIVHHDIGCLLEVKTLGADLARQQHAHRGVFVELLDADSSLVLAAIFWRGRHVARDQFEANAVPTQALGEIGERALVEAEDHELPVRLVGVNFLDHLEKLVKFGIDALIEDDSDGGGNLLGLADTQRIGLHLFVGELVFEIVDRSRVVVLDEAVLSDCAGAEERGQATRHLLLHGHASKARDLLGLAAACGAVAPTTLRREKVVHPTLFVRQNDFGL